MLKPTGFRVLVKDIIKEDQNIGGIIIPDNAKELDGTAVVIELGRGMTNKAGKVETAYPVAIGDKVIIPMNRECGTVVNYGADRYKIFDVEDILAIVTD